MGLWPCLWRITVIALVSVGRHIVIMDRTIPWAEDPTLHKEDRELSISVCVLISL